MIVAGILGMTSVFLLSVYLLYPIHQSSSARQLWEGGSAKEVKNGVHFVLSRHNGGNKSKAHCPLSLMNDVYSML